MENEATRLTEQERLSVKIEEILAKVNTDPNPEELESIKKLIKQRVPFTRRGYFSAMLLKTLVSSRGDRQDRRRPTEKPKAHVENTRKEEKPENKAKKQMPEDAKTLYMNIGKMKHLYAKDLSKLLQSELNISRDDIYSLCVHDKYSFITMSEENCNKAIEKLNGKEINGRVAQISFSNR